MKKQASIAPFLGFFLLALAAPGGALASSPLERLRAAIEEVVQSAPGEMGVAVKHLETGQEITVNANQRFPMASTFKVPILVELFNQVDEGKIRLDEMVPLGPEDQHLGSGALKSFVVPGVALSIENLAHLMMRISDNSATDWILARVGIENVNRRLALLGVTGISVNRSCQKLILDSLGVDFEKFRGKTYAEVEKMLNDYKPDPRQAEEAALRLAEGAQDTATPAGMNQLLEKIFQGEAARPESCQKMIEIMLKCETGQNRIRGLLPRSVQVAHKTGTIGGTVNNAGIIFLPERQGHLALTVLSKKMKEASDAEQAIANVARYVYDYFHFTAPVAAESLQ